jgi:type IV secretory pathway VirB10-like protein
MEKVSVNKGVLAGVVAVAAGSLLAVAFLLGRSSGPAAPPVPPDATPVRDVIASPGSGAQAPDLPRPTPAPAVLSVAPFADASAATPPPPSPQPREAFREAARPAAVAGGADAARSGPDRAVVAAYLDAIDRVQPGATGGSPEGIANELAAALANGDTSGLDGLIRETEDAKERLTGLRPPAACAAHHRESLGSLDDALGVLRSLKTAMESPDPAAGLAQVAEQATALRSRAEALRREETTLREGYGLTR